MMIPAERQASEPERRQGFEEECAQCYPSFYVKGLEAALAVAAEHEPALDGDNFPTLLEKAIAGLLATGAYDPETVSRAEAAAITAGVTRGAIEESTPKVKKAEGKT